MFILKKLKKMFSSSEVKQIVQNCQNIEELIQVSDSLGWLFAQGFINCYYKKSFLGFILMRMLEISD